MSLQGYLEFLQYLSWTVAGLGGLYVVAVVADTIHHYLYPLREYARQREINAIREDLIERRRQGGWSIGRASERANGITQREEHMLHHMHWGWFGW